MAVQPSDLENRLMLFFALCIPGRRQLLRLLFVFTALLPAVAAAACDGGSATPTSEYGGANTTSKGQAIFMRYCNTCHPGGERGVGPSLITRNEGAEEIKAVVRHGKAQMPGFGAKVISDDDLNALVDYVIGMKH